METQDLGVQISNLVEGAYHNYRYGLVVVPMASVEERCAFIAQHVQHLQ